MTVLRPARRAFLAGALAAPALAALPAWAKGAVDLGPELAALFEPEATDARRAAFWAERLSTAGRERWPLEAFQDEVRGVAELSGGVDLLDVRHVPDGPLAQLSFRLWSRRQGLARWVRARVDRDEPERLLDFSDLPFPEIYDRTGPDGPVSRAGLAAEVERRVRYAVERDDFSGCVKVTAPDGETVWQGAFGLADRETGRVNTLETPFHIGSADKSFTALMIGRLVREGRLTFDTPLIEVLPDYANAEFARVCTIQHLLTHSAGLGGLFERPGWDGKRPFTRMAELLPAFAGEPPYHVPGTETGYSNEGFVVLGAVIEAVTGLSWFDLLAEQVYRPAGMAGSGHFRIDEQVGVKAVGYMYPEGDRLGFGAREANEVRQGYRGNSCGGGYSTVGDMTRYLRALREGRLMPPEQAAEFIAAQPGGLRGYGRGFQVRATPEGRTVVGHSGGGPRSGIDGYHRIVWETGWAVSILGNYDSPFAGEIGRDITRWLTYQEA